MPTLSLRLLTKFAVTLVLDDRVKLQAAVPLQPPIQPLNVNPASGVAFKVTVAPAVKLERQLVPQSIPEGVLVTVPLPVFETERLSVLRVNVAVQVLLAFMVTDDVGELPEQSPDHAVSFEFAAGFAVKVIVSFRK
jgi:hypothetical protein